MRKAQCQFNPQNVNFRKCGKKPVAKGLGYYTTERFTFDLDGRYLGVTNESPVEINLCESCAKYVRERLKTTGERVKNGVVMLWSVQPIAHSEMRQAKTR